MEKNEFFSEFQASFRNERSTTENLIVLEEIRRQANTGIPTFGLGVDLTRAFASVDVELLIKRLNEQGVSKKFQKIVEALFSDNFLSILLNGKAGEYFSVNKGLGEGTSISPVLFIFYFEFLRGLLDETEVTLPLFFLG